VSDAGARALRRLAGFTATLRDNGFAVGLAESADGARIIASPLAARPALLGQAFRALFCSDADEWRRFDEIFAAWWLDRGVRRATKLSGAMPRQAPRTLRQIAEAGAPKREPQAADAPRDRGADSRDNPADQRGRREGASRAETLDRTDFRHISDPDALAAAHAAAARLAEALRTRLTRRVRVATAGRRLDMRRTIRASIARGGTPLDLHWRRRRVRPLALVVLLDASGSMSLYTAIFTRFVHGVIHSFRESEAFLFHTRLVQISDAMRETHPQRAVDRLSLLAEGVGGGTRIGACLAQFNRWHASRVLTSRSVLMIVSDGYDTDEPGAVGAAMAALRRHCRRIVWLNPMLGWDGYAPVARGMAEALPHVDLFAPAHNLESLIRLETYLARL
jgi:uncharacterized protein with von Willebrand factor type A (vWA) domain